MTDIPKTIAPRPLPCRLNELYQELKAEEARFHAAKNDEGECAVYAAAERLKEVVSEYFTDVKVAQASFPGVFSEVIAEVSRAAAKFPTWPTDPLHALAVLGEEFGELTKAVVQATYEPEKNERDAVRKEAIQTAAMALRFLLSLDRYEYTRCPQHKQGA